MSLLVNAHADFLFLTSLYFLLIYVENVTAGHLLRQPHNLSCYQCHSLTDGDSCRYLQLNNPDTQSCKPTELFCSVILFQYSIESSDYNFYSVQRRCEESCQEGCSTVGERIKLFLCRSCCNGYLCNYGNGSKKNVMFCNHYLLLIAGIVLLNFFSFLESFESLFLY